MILFISGRCDIPAFYMPWFMNRIKEGFVDVRNPYDVHQISRVLLEPEIIDCLYFCTKNPLPFVPHLSEIPFPYFIHVTITPYHEDVEPSVPDKHQIIEAVKLLSKRLGKDRVMVRYDPILINQRYTVEYHKKAFHTLMSQLEGYVDTCILSFVDLYKNTKANQIHMKLETLDEQAIIEMAKSFQQTAKLFHIHLQTCAEKNYDLSQYEIYDRPCVDIKQVHAVTGKPIQYRKLPSIRKQLCDCLPTVDIGDYNACAHACLYCYANYNAKQVHDRMKLHDSTSSVLLGHVETDDRVTIRKDYKL